MRKWLLAAFGIAIFVGSRALAQPPQCSENEVGRAENAIDGANNWTQIFGAFKSYSQCDDGAVAEGYDDKIVTLLVNRWETITQLQEIVNSNPDFERFILKHIDTLMSPKQGTAIVENARKRCPAGSAELCAQLEMKALHPNG